ncbi:MAG: 3-phosphoshikimate 1-carboxyvinyltransferase, partial [Candidatus Hydrothermarchaeaceae archaeon]
MELKVRKITGVEKTIRAPPSKSYTHRAFVVASLAEGRSDIKTCLKAGDTLSTLEACRAFGVAVEEGKHVTIHGCGGKLKTPRSTINCGNSGTTIRLISGMAALDGKVKLTGDESVKARPMQPLLDALNQFGVRAISEGGDGKPPVIIKGGRLLGGTVKIEGGISSQFISSLLLIAPYAAEDIEILLLSRLKSRPYVDITLDVMQKFGGVAENEDYNKFVVEAGATYKGQNYQIEGDYSAASYFLALAAMTNSKITV